MERCRCIALMMLNQKPLPHNELLAHLESRLEFKDPRHQRSFNAPFDHSGRLKRRKSIAVFTILESRNPSLNL